MSLVIKNGTAFINGSFVKKDLSIEGGVIDAIGPDLKGDETIDATGFLVLPGLIDPHVHLREPGDTYKEDFATGSHAAIAGGFTTVMDMPNNAIPTITKERFDEKIRLAKEKAICDILFHFGGTDNNFDEVKRANPKSLKLYLGKTTGDLLLKNPSSISKHFSTFPNERPIVLHACDDAEDQEKNLEHTYEGIEKVVSLAKDVKRKIHLAHASTNKEVMIAKSYERCTVEVAPHHLFLSTNDIARLGPLATVLPPLRTEQKRIGLWKSLEKVDCIATDHAPHTIEDKDEGAPGFPGLETSLSLMLDGCDRGLIDKIWVVQRMSENVAELFDIEKKGKLAKGYFGDVTIVDTKKEWKVDGTELETKCKWSPFDGKVLKGKVHTVIKSGEPVYIEYQFI